VGLTLAETLVKNCHDPVYREMSSERFMAAVAKIARVSMKLQQREGRVGQDHPVLWRLSLGEAHGTTRATVQYCVDRYFLLSPPFQLFPARFNAVLFPVP